MGKTLKLILVFCVFLTSICLAEAEEPSWIWFPDAGSVKGEPRYFRTVFELDEIPYSLLARVVVNHETVVYINGERMRTIYPEEILGSVELVDYVVVGKNVLAVEIKPKPDEEIKPLLMRVVDIDDNVVLGTGSTWRAANKECEGWLNTDFDDSNWAKVVASPTMQKPELSSAELLAMMGQFAPEVDEKVLQNASVWLTHSAEFVFTTDAPKEEFVMPIVTGTNQIAAMQLAIRSGEAIGALEVRFTDLYSEDGKSVISKDNFKYSFVETWHMTNNSTQTPANLLIRAPQDMPDILSDKKVINVPKDYTQSIYLQFYVPKGTPAGIYSGSVILDNLGAEREVPVEIEVLPVELSDETNLKVTIWYQVDYIVTYNKVTKYSEEFWRILEYYAKTMAEHRQNMFWLPIGTVNLRYNEEGQLTGNFETFDRWAEIFFKHGFKYIELSHFGGRVGDWNSDFGPYRLVAYDAGLKTTREVPVSEFAYLLQEHLREKGWLEIAYAHVADEPTGQNYRSWIDLALEIKKGAPDLKLMEAIHYTYLSDYLDIAIPQLDYFDQNRTRLLKDQEDRKIELWFYTCWLPQGNYPNRLLDYPLYKTRILHWANFLYDAPGYLHWGYNWWNAFEVGYAPGDGWIVYPTETAMVPSVRYEAMREGIEDYEYLLLHAKKTGEIAKKLGVEIDEKYRAKEIARTVMTSLTRYTDDPLELLQARERLLREIAEMDQGPLCLVVTSVEESTRLTEPTEVELTVYAEDGCSVFVGGRIANEVSPGKFTATVVVTPEKPTVVVEVVLGNQIKTIERNYSNWRIIN